MKARLLGASTSLQKTAAGLEGRTAEAAWKVRFLGSNAVRIQIDPTGLFEENPYALVSESIAQLATNHAFKEESTSKSNPNSLVFVSDRARLVVDLNHLRFSFTQADGSVLCEDEPGLGTAVQGTHLSTYKTLQPDERFVGLGEKTGPLNRKGHAYTHWNTDAFGYGDGTDPIYLSTPFYLGLHHGRCYGFFLVNSYKSEFNFGASNNRFSSVTVESGCLDYILIAGQTPAEIVSFYTLLTGRTPLPPRWALGLQQCRYSYYPDYEVTTLADTYRNKRIPADVIYLDIHYMDAYKVFTWSPTNYPNPKALTQKLADQGFKTVVIFDPGVKVEKGYPAYDEGLAGNHFVRYPDGELYQGQVWPGWCHFPDFTKPDARAWWATMMQQVVDDGVSGFWTDMNEPATWGQRVPNILDFDLEGRSGSHQEAHNLYGLTMAKATSEGAAAAREGLRPFVLTRAGFSGIQRYAAVWTGDNRAEDDHMLLGARMLNSMGLAGVGFCGTDIGGFVGDGDRKLFARWLTIGAFSPLCRIHSMIDSRDSEPWTYGEKVEAIARNYISLRYGLMPYYYSLFKELEEKGIPVQRSLVLSDPWADQTYAYAYQNQFTVGEFLLVAPVSAYQDFGQVFLPSRGTDPWYYLYTDSQWPSGEPVAKAPLEFLPVFVQAGAIIPMRSVVQHEGDADDGVLTVHFYKGSSPTQFAFYWDAGDGFEYQTSGYHRRTIRQTPHNRTLTLELAEGDLALPWQTLRIVLHGFHTHHHVTVNHKQVVLAKSTFAFVEPLPDFDPFGNETTAYRCAVQVLEIPYSKVALEIKY